MCLYLHYWMSQVEWVEWFHGITYLLTYECLHTYICVHVCTILLHIWIYSYVCISFEYLCWVGMSVILSYCSVNVSVTWNIHTYIYTYLAMRGWKRNTNSNEKASLKYIDVYTHMFTYLYTTLQGGGLICLRGSK